MELKESEYQDNMAQYSAYIAEQVGRIHELDEDYYKLNEIIASTEQQISEVEKQHQIISKFVLLLSTTQE